jgi:hypothetical protein
LKLNSFAFSNAVQKVAVQRRFDVSASVRDVLSVSGAPSKCPHEEERPMIESRSPAHPHRSVSLVDLHLVSKLDISAVWEEGSSHCDQACEERHRRFLRETINSAMPMTVLSRAYRRNTLHLQPNDWVIEDQS